MLSQNRIPLFIAVKSADQTGIVSATPTKLVWGTEVVDRGGYFASDAWVPPAGKVRIGVSALVTGATMAVNGIGAIYIYKNGSAICSVIWGAISSNNGANVHAIKEDLANGTDSYTSYIYVTTTSGTATVGAVSTATYFWGYGLPS